MKTPILACIVLALTGCSSRPGDGDIEHYLEPLLASCENIKLGGADKTNGFEGEDGYRVKFDYTIKVDGDKLDKLRAAYDRQKGMASAVAAEEADYAARRKALQTEIDALNSAFGEANPLPNAENFHTGADKWNLTSAEVSAYGAAGTEWRARRAENTKAKRLELDELDAAISATRAQRPPRAFDDTDHIGSEMWNFYTRGCSAAAGPFLRPLLSEKANDPTEWFERRKFDMESELVMRKTEQGWRVTGAE